MVKAVCPGSFDPVTNGHLDVIQRALRIFSHVTVAVLTNDSKECLFDQDERIDMLQDSCKKFENVNVESFKGLLVDFCRERDISVIIKGIRAVTDYDYELQMAQMNNRLSGIETIFVPTDPAYGYLSSSLVKEVAKHDGNVSSLLPSNVVENLKRKFKKDK